MRKVLAFGILVAFAVGPSAAFAQAVSVTIPFETIYYCTYQKEYVALEGVATGTWDTSGTDATLLTVSFAGVHGIGLLSGATYEIPGEIVQRIVPTVNSATAYREVRVPLTVYRGDRAGTCLSWDITITPTGAEAPESYVAICGHCHANRQD